jgi:hypothetical protein
MTYAVNYTDLDVDDFHPRACLMGLFYGLIIVPARKELVGGAFAMLLPTGCASLFLIVKLSYFLNAPEFPFIVCAAPLVVQMALVIYAHIFRWQTPLDDSSERVERFALVCPLAFFWAVAVVVLSIELDGYIDIGWYYTLIPMFVTFGWPAFYTVWAPILAVLPCCDDCMSDYSLWAEYGNKCEKCYFAVPYNISVSLPLLTFLSLIATNLENERFDSYSAQFAPVFCMCVVATLLWVWGRIAIL